MPRKLRIEYPGAMYHPPAPRLRWASVMNRGDQREPIFKDEEDRRKFLLTVGEACQKRDWQVHAYGLMRNHFHLSPGVGDAATQPGGRDEMAAGRLHQAVQHPTGLQKAERIVREELGRMGWPEDELRGRSKGHPGKVVIARRLRQETTMSLQWIAERLQMGTWTYVSNLLNQKRAEASAAQEVPPLCQ